MKYNPSFLNVKSGVSLQGAFEADWIESKETLGANVMQLPLIPNEVYNQFIIVAPEQAGASINSVTLCDESGISINDYFEYGFISYPDFDAIYFSFKLLKEYDGCLRFRFNFNTSASNYRSAYSSKFTCENGNKDFTSLITYRNSQNIYNIPYSETADPALWQQIRLPIWYAHKKTESDSEESIYNTDEYSNINVSRVERRFLNVWRVLASENINERLAIVSDCSQVYINGKREVCRPFVFEELQNGGAVVSSMLETQTIFGDEFIDKTGYLGIPIRINEVIGGCCDESGGGADPVIDSDNEVASGCEGNGFGWEVEILGEPNSIGKSRVTATDIQGQTKNLFVTGGVEAHNFSFTNFEGGQYEFFYELDDNGYCMLTFRSCFEDCAGSELISASFKLELYDLEMNEISSENVTFGSQVNCVPVGYVPEMIIRNDIGINTKIIDIQNGVPNGVANIRINILGAEGLPLPNNNVTFGTLLDVNGVEFGDSWIVQVPLDNNGEATGIVFSCSKAGQYDGTTAPSIHVSARALDSNLQNTYNIIAIYDV